MTREEIIDGLEIHTVGRLNNARVYITVEELQKFIDAIKALEQEPREITLEDVKEYCKPRCLSIISNELLHELTHRKIKMLNM